MGPLGCPLVEHLRAGQRAAAISATLSAALAAAAGSMSLESLYSSLLSGSCTIGITLSIAACADTVFAVIAATTPSSWPSAGTGTWASSTIGALCADSSATPSTLKTVGYHD